jgi:hypothetical protein
MGNKLYKEAQKTEGLKLGKSALEKTYRNSSASSIYTFVIKAGNFKSLIYVDLPVPP